MDAYNVVIQAIASVGFPIVMCLILMYYIKMKDTQHEEEMGKMSEALKNNTIAILNLTAKLEQFNSKER
jgi:hypothetical protein